MSVKIDILGDTLFNAALAGVNVTAARAELAQLRGDLQAAQTTIALNKYVTPPFDLTDDATVQLALECAAKDERIAELEADVSEARKLIEYVMPSVQPYMVTQLRAWLAAHPAPQAEQDRTPL